MAVLIWNIEFYPSAGENYSPEDYINNLSSTPQEVASIKHRLSAMRELNIQDWPRTWVKNFTYHKIKIYQLTASENHRLYFGIDGKTIVVCYMCKKVRQRALPKDLKRAAAIFAEYFNEKG